MNAAHRITLALLALVATTTIVGCGNRQMYEGFQASQRANCLSAEPEKYDDCMEAANISFETYQMQRAEAKE